MEKQSQSLLEQRAERIVEKGIREDKIAGACVAVLHDQEQLLFRAYGMADKERQIPMRTDSIFRMFSMTKPVTAVVTMQLLEDGLLELRSNATIICRSTPKARRSSFRRHSATAHSADAQTT